MHIISCMAITVLLWSTYLERYRMIGGVYRGNLVQASDYLEAACRIIIHISAVHIRTTPSRALRPIGVEEEVAVV